MGVGRGGTVDEVEFAGDEGDEGLREESGGLPAGVPVWREESSAVWVEDFVQMEPTEDTPEHLETEGEDIQFRAREGEMWGRRAYEVARDFALRVPLEDDDGRVVLYRRVAIEEVLVVAKDGVPPPPDSIRALVFG